MLTALIDRVRLHAVLGVQLRRMLARAPRPDDRGRVLVVGEFPIRVLLVGAGLAPGYGATDREHALDGVIGAELARKTGRGVTVEHRVVPALPIAAGVALLGEVGAHTYDIVVWCPTFTELPFTVSFRLWQSRLRAIVRRLEDTRQAQTRLVLLGLPPIDGSPRLVRIADGWMARINDRIRATISDSEHALYVRPLPLTITGPESLPLNDEYYAACGAHIVRELLPHLPIRPRRDGQG